MKKLSYKKVLAFIFPLTIFLFLFMFERAKSMDDHDWEQNAQESIDKYRRVNLKIKLLDSSNNLYDSAKIHVQMLKHSFGFGTAIDTEAFLKNDMYRSLALDKFNEIVPKNALKWPRWVSRRYRDAVDTVIDTLIANNVKVRGHNLIWPKRRCCPEKIISMDSSKMRKEITNHISRKTAYYNGRLADWDAINEPCSNAYFIDYFGEEVTKEWMAAARKEDSKVPLFINEAGILSKAGFNEKKQNCFFEKLENLNDQNYFDGIGFQCHFHSKLPSFKDMDQAFEKFAAFGKQIKISELDIDFSNTERQAEFMKKFMTWAFSKPEVVSIIHWDFWEGTHWKPRAALYSEDWKMRKHGNVWENLVFDKWWTNEVVSTDLKGETELRVFKGEYKFEITRNGRLVKEFTKIIEENVDFQIII